MDRFLEWLRGFRALIFVNNLHIHSAGGSRGKDPGWRPLRPPMLQPPAAPAVRPRHLQVRLAPTRREMALGPGRSSNEIRASWQRVIRELDTPRAGSR
jgi:hypothetical protein